MDLFTEPITRERIQRDVEECLRKKREGRPRQDSFEVRPTRSEVLIPRRRLDSRVAQLPPRDRE